MQTFFLSKKRVLCTLLLMFKEHTLGKQFQTLPNAEHFLLLFAAHGPLFTNPGPLLGALGPLLGAPGPLSGCSSPLLGRSWLLLGPSWPLLGRSWPLLGRSGGALGRSQGARPVENHFFCFERPPLSRGGLGEAPLNINKCLRDG